MFQRDTNNCKEATILPVRTISSQVAIFFLGGAGNSDYILSYVIRRKERLALKDRVLTADKERF